MSRDVLVISRLFLVVYIYNAGKFFIHRECSSVEIVECSKRRCSVVIFVTEIKRLFWWF